MIYDLIVVGLGAIGSAALFQAAKSGARVLGIDRHHPPHKLGSTHAETRITRLAVGEGAPYWPLVRRSHAIWRELEQQSGEQLMFTSGGYIITPAAGHHVGGSHWDGFVERSAHIAGLAGVPFERHAPSIVRARHPQILIGDDEQAGYEPSGGVVLCERAVGLQLSLAQRMGAAVRFDEPVIELQVEPDGVRIVSDRAVYRAAKVILAAGPWIGDFLPADLRPLLRVTRQVVYWFAADDPAQYSVERFPFLIWLGKRAEDYFCAFPTPPGGVGGVKLMTERFVDATDPQVVMRDVTPAEIERFYDEFVRRKLTGIAQRCVSTAVCLYTNTPDDHFIVDSDPRSEHLLIASPCSGHGFKHSAALGEALVQLALDGSCDVDLSAFKLSRFA